MERGQAAHRPSASKFRRLAITHALMMGGDAAMVVALADSLFFDIDLDAARSRVLLFLLVGFAPFLVVAPLIGPLIDRVAGGRKFVIQVVALARIVLTLLMAQNIDNFALFPLVFASLVLQKTYAVSKSAIVPSTVRSEDGTRRGELEAGPDRRDHRSRGGDPRRAAAADLRCAGDARLRRAAVRRCAWPRRPACRPTWWRPMPRTRRRCASCTPRTSSLLRSP